MVYHSKRRRGEVWGGVWGEGHASSHAHPEKLKKIHFKYDWFWWNLSDLIDLLVNDKSG